MKNRVLVTGGTGFVGSHLVESLINNNYDVTATLRKNSNLKWLKDLSINTVEVQWDNPLSVDEAVNNVDYVIHCAGVTKGLKYHDYKVGNVIPTIHLLKSCLKNSNRIKRFIFISTQAVAGPAPGSKPINEDFPARPLTDYGFSKLEAELEVLKFRDNLPVTILRPCSIYGPRDYEFYPIFQLLKKNLALIVGDGTKQINMIHVKDFVTCILETMKTEHESGSIFFTTDGSIYNWNDIYQTAQQVYDKKPITLKLPLIIPRILGKINDYVSAITKKPALLNSQKIQEMIPDYWLCDSSRFQEVFQFQTKYNLNKGFQETLDWYLENKWL